jgi:phosphoribosylanthranilate isomerase
MTRTRIKICGITRAQDMDAAVRMGADAIGFVLVPSSRRFIALEAAAIMRRSLPPFVSAVALLMNHADDEIARILEVLRPDWLQFHGAESPSDCARFGHPHIKAVAMATKVGERPPDLASIAAQYHDAGALLVDGHAPGEMGGSGQRVAIDETWPVLDKPLILAGGLRPENVSGAVRGLRPYAVDVSSGVETAPGIKDQSMIKAFIEEVRRADEH